MTQTDGLQRFTQGPKVCQRRTWRCAVCVTITRSGFIIECVSKQQQDELLRIKEYEDHSSLNCFLLWSEIKKKGVTSGVPLLVEDESFQSTEDVCEARKLTIFQQTEKEESNLVCLTFVGELPEKIYLDYICYRVRLCETAPLTCCCSMWRSQKMWVVWEEQL